MAAKNFRAIEF
jgi:hypothetical protein